MLCNVLSVCLAGLRNACESLPRPENSALNFLNVWTHGYCRTTHNKVKLAVATVAATCPTHITPWKEPVRLVASGMERGGTGAP